MANALTTFVDYECKRETGIPLYPGTVEFHGALASWDSWSTTNGAYILNRAPTSGEVEFSGGNAIYDINVPYNLPWITEEGGSQAERDKYAYDPAHPEYESFGKVYNINFISVNSEEFYSYCFGLWCDKSEYSFYWNIAFYQYTQLAWGVSQSDRTTWSYGSVDGIAQAPLFSQHSDLDLSGEASNYSQVKVYVAEQDGIKCYVFAFGIKPSGEVGSNTRIIAVPFSFFANREPEERTGPVSEDAADESFAELRPFYRDEIIGYNLSSMNTDPLGLCTSNGTTKLVAIEPGDYSKLIDGIYTGSSSTSYNSESLADLASQIASVYNPFSSTGNRPVDTLQTMLSAIQTIKILPDIAIPAQNDTNITSIGGYSLGETVPAKRLTRQIVTSVFANKTISKTLSPQTASFLNYGPYTQATLILPFVGNVSIDPSELYASDDKGRTYPGTISVEFALDCLTGLLTLYTWSEVKTNETTYVAKHLINLSQANVGVDIPISGMGGASLTTSINSISSVMSTAMGAVSSFASGNVMGGISGTIGTAGSIAQAGIDMSKTYCVQNKGIGSIAPYFSPTNVALMITYPKAFNSKYFGKHIGIISNISGEVQEFKGYAEFINVDVSGINAPDYIKHDIISRLQSGVII